MDYKKREEFTSLHIQMRRATDSLYTQATDVYEIAKRIEKLTKDTSIHYAGLRVRVEARAVWEQATDLRREMEEMGKELRGQA
jgi:hypothetical protein